MVGEVEQPVPVRRVARQARGGVQGHPTGTLHRSPSQPAALGGFFSPPVLCGPQICDPCVPKPKPQKPGTTGHRVLVPHSVAFPQHPNQALFQLKPCQLPLCTFRRKGNTHRKTHWSLQTHWSLPSASIRLLFQDSPEEAGTPPHLARHGTPPQGTSVPKKLDSLRAFPKKYNNFWNIN